MMSKIKNFVFFVLGIIYGWALTYCLTNAVKSGTSPLIIPAMVIAFFGGFGIIFVVVYFLLDNWNKP